MPLVRLGGKNWAASLQHMPNFIELATYLVCAGYCQQGDACLPAGGGNIHCGKAIYDYGNRAALGVGIINASKVWGYLPEILATAAAPGWRAKRMQRRRAVVTGRAKKAVHLAGGKSLGDRTVPAARRLWQRCRF